MFVTYYTPIFYKAVGESVYLMLSGEDFNKSQWNTHLQKNYGISKGHTNGVISSAKGAVYGTKECRILHRKTLDNNAKYCVEKNLSENSNYLGIFTRKNLAKQ